MLTIIYAYFMTFQIDMLINEVVLNASMNCLSKNVINLLNAKNAHFLTVQTRRQLIEHFSEHKTSVRTFQKYTITDHFKKPGHRDDAQKTFIAIKTILKPGLQIFEKWESLRIKKTLRQSLKD